MNPAKDKGTRAETWAVREAQAWGLACRRHDMGQGHGDLEIRPDGWAGGSVVVQVKHADDKHYSRNRPPLAWLNQAHTQAEKAGAALGILLVKPDGIAYHNVPDWHAWLWLGDFVSLIHAEGIPLPRWEHAGPVRVPFGSILTLLGGKAPTP